MHRILRRREIIQFFNAFSAKDQPYLRFKEDCLRIQVVTRQKEPAIFLLFASAINSIVQRIEAQRDLIVHNWYADYEMLSGKICQGKLALDIIAEYGVWISFVLETHEDKNVMTKPRSTSPTFPRKRVQF